MLQTLQHQQQEQEARIGFAAVWSGCVSLLRQDTVLLYSKVILQQHLWQVKEDLHLQQQQQLGLPWQQHHARFCLFIGQCCWELQQRCPAAMQLLVQLLPAAALGGTCCRADTPGICC
jgi:hypothetical protein